MEIKKRIRMIKVPFNHVWPSRAVSVIRNLGPITVGKILANAAIEAGHAEPLDDGDIASGNPIAQMDRDELVKLAEDEGIDLEAIEGTGANGNVLVADIRNAIMTAAKD